MARQDINIGVNNNDGTGDLLRDAMRKVNENFIELYNTSENTNFQFVDSTIKIENGALVLDTSGTNTVEIVQGITVNSGNEFINSTFLGSNNSPILTVDVTNNRVGILNSTPTVTLDITGDAAISGSTNLRGNTTLGTNTSNTIVVNGRFNGSLVPVATTGLNLGSTSLRWDNVYVNNFTTTNITATTINSTTLTGDLTGDVVGALTTSDTIRFIDDSFITTIDTITLTNNRNLFFPNRSGTFVVNDNNRLNGPYGSPPASSIGDPNDIQGDIAIDDNFIYYCLGGYDGSTAIWKRATLNAW